MKISKKFSILFLDQKTNFPIKVFSNLLGSRCGKKFIFAKKMDEKGVWEEKADNEKRLTLKNVIYLLD